MARFVTIVVGALLLLCVALAGSYVFDAYLQSPSGDAESVAFTVAEGDRGIGVAQALEEAGLIHGSWMFRAYLRLSGTGSDFKPGTFELRPGMSYASIVSALSRASSQEVQVTIPEGFTLAQIGERVREALPQISEEEWTAATVTAPSFGSTKAAWFVGQVKPSGVDLEGYLFPDTYRFFSDASARDVVDKMVDEMNDRLGAELVTVADENGFSRPGALTPHEVLTLASVIQREVQSPSDMKDVADVFLKRLEMGMPLQADSTISYYLGKTSAELTVDDLRADEPYNTYTRAGLPPGPIASPGTDAIDAVLHPTDNPYLYFLTASDGTVIYASTFEEHVANKNRFLR